MPALGFLKNPFIQRRALVFVALSLLLSATNPAIAKNSSADTGRQDFLQALDDLSRNDFDAAKRIQIALEDHPLAPYIEYMALRRKLKQGRSVDSQLTDFLSRHGDLASAKILRRTWIASLGKRRQWQRLLDAWDNSEYPGQRCLWVRARIAVAPDTTTVDDALALWRVGHSQPKDCDPVFKWLEKQSLLDTEERWERINLALASSNISLARFVARELPPADRQNFERWEQMHRQPEKGLRQALVTQENWHEPQIMHGMKRLIRNDPGLAADLLDPIKQYFAFDADQRQSMDRSIALRSAWQRRPDGLSRLLSLTVEKDDEIVRTWTLRSALHNRDWATALKSSETLAANEPEKAEWRYWQARALEATGDQKAAKKLYVALSRERDYYGYLAADRLELGYALNNEPLRVNQTLRALLLASPAIQRARELWFVNQETMALREWLVGTNDLPKDELIQAALLAYEWNWRFAAARSLGKAGEFSDLARRYPTPWLEHVEQRARDFAVDESWIYGVLRSESLYRENARSHAGAMGLMQLMPRTGRGVAKRQQLRLRSTQDLLQPEINIRLGSAYLREMLSRFDENQVLATAAYNAGPTAIAKYLPSEMAQDADIWVDTLPIQETRKYVKRVLASTVVFDWRLRGEVLRLASRMPPIQPNTY